MFCGNKTCSRCVFFAPKHVLLLAAFLHRAMFPKHVRTCFRTLHFIRRKDMFDYYKICFVTDRTHPWLCTDVLRKGMQPSVSLHPLCPCAAETRGVGGKTATCPPVSGRVLGGRADVTGEPWHAGGFSGLPGFPYLRFCLRDLNAQVFFGVLQGGLEFLH